MAIGHICCREIAGNLISASAIWNSVYYHLMELVQKVRLGKLNSKIVIKWEVLFFEKETCLNIRPSLGLFLWNRNVKCEFKAKKFISAAAFTIVGIQGLHWKLLLANIDIDRELYFINDLLLLYRVFSLTRKCFYWIYIFKRPVFSKKNNLIAKSCPPMPFYENKKKQKKISQWRG